MTRAKTNTTGFQVPQKMVGRSDEIAALQEAYQRASRGKSELVLVAGRSGTGKTRLVETLRNKVSHQGGFFVTGKFDPLWSNDRPYSAIMAAFSDLVDLVLSSESIEEKRTQLQTTLGPDVNVMSSILTNLRYLIPSRSVQSDDEEESSLRHALSRLQWICRNFVNALASAETPICIFLDDLHDADHGSMEVILSLLTDTSSQHILFVAAYREDQVNMCNVLGKDMVLPVTEIHIGCLSEEQIQDLLISTLQANEVVDLASAVLAKTNGNPHFVYQFLRKLERDGLLALTTKDGTQQPTWEYDVNQILAKTNVSENVLELLTAKLQRLDETIKLVLQLASCLGFYFDATTLELVVDSTPQNVKKLSVVIDAAQCEGLIEVTSTPFMYKFSHDSVRDRFYGMIGDECAMTHLHIGRTMIASGAKDWTRDEATFLLAVDQLNKGSPCMTKTDERVDLARLNLQAGKMTVSKAGLLPSGLPSASYFRHGLTLLEAETRWEQQYDLCLDLATHLAEEETSAGRFAESAEISHEVIENAKSLRESLRVHTALINTLFMEGRIKDVTKYCLVLLPQLGINLPKEPHKGHEAMELIKTKFATRKLPVVYQETKNEETIVAMQTLAMFITCSFLSEENAYVTIATCRMIRMSLRFGLSKYSPIGFASYAMVHASMNKRAKSIRYGELSMDLVDRLNAGNEVGARVQVVAMGFSLHWKRPWRDILEAQNLGYRKGLETDDLDGAFLCAHMVVLLAFLSGTNLRECEELGETLCTQMVQHSQITWWSMTLPMWQLFQCLMTGRPGGSLLTGDVMDQEEMETNARLQGNHLLIRVICLSRLFLACLSSSWKQSDDLVKHVDVHMEALAAYVLFPVYKFLAALTWLVRSGTMFKDNKCQRKYRLKARQVMRRMETWISEGAINVRPLLLILVAEDLARKGSTSEIKEAFQVAIAECRNHNLPHFQAMANERAGVLLTGKLDTGSASSYFSAAKDLYEDYGATGKVRDLEEKIQSSSFTKRTDSTSTFRTCPIADITFSSNGRV